jgi:hypothetical protein
MRVGYLKFAFSVACGILCLLLIALWVRSYWRADWIDRFDKNELQTTVGSNSGRLIFSQLDWTQDPAGHVAPHNWTHMTASAVASHEKRWAGWVNASGLLRVAISHWVLVLPVAALAAVPWIRWRFALRTLLIAMTAIAVLLAIVVATN